MTTSQVINKDPSKIKGEFDDVSKVEKYEMSDDDYSKRTGIMNQKERERGFTLMYRFSSCL